MSPTVDFGTARLMVGNVTAFVYELAWKVGGIAVAILKVAAEFGVAVTWTAPMDRTDSNTGSNESILSEDNMVSNLQDRTWKLSFET